MASKCCVPLSEEQHVDLCRNRIRRKIALLLNEQITTFRELANEACRKERLLALQKEGSVKKDKENPDKKKKGKAGSSVNTMEVKTEVKPKPKSNENFGTQYSFTDAEVYPILWELLRDNVIQLPAPRFPAEVELVNHPLYCHYHRRVSHPDAKS